MAEEISIIDINRILEKALYEQDRDALAHLHNNYSHRIKSYISSHISSAADAEELTQDVFLQLCKTNDHYKNQNHPEAYLFGLARNVVRKFHRQNARTVQTIPFESINSLEESHPSEPDIYSTERKRMIETALKSLSPKAREAVKLRFIDGLSPREAAKKMGSSLNTFYQRQYQAIRKLKDLEIISKNQL